MRMQMKSILMKRVWNIGEGFKDTVETVEAGLIDILNLDPEAEVLTFVKESILLKGETVLTFKDKNTQATTAEVRIENVPEETDIFGDLIPAHISVTYLHVA